MNLEKLRLTVEIMVDLDSWQSNYGEESTGSRVEHVTESVEEAIRASGPCGCGTYMQVKVTGHVVPMSPVAPTSGRPGH